MRITFDQAKRDRTLATRGLAIEDAALVFEGTTLVVEDNRTDYGKTRVICYGYLVGRIVVIGYT